MLSKSPLREKKISKEKEIKPKREQELPDDLKFILRPRLNWSKEQKSIDEIDPNELKKV